MMTNAYAINSSTISDEDILNSCLKKCARILRVVAQHCSEISETRHEYLDCIGRAKIEAGECRNDCHKGEKKEDIDPLSKEFSF